MSSLKRLVHQTVKELADMASAMREQSEAGRVAREILKTRLKQEFIPKSERRANVCYAFPCQAPYCQELGVCVSDGPYEFNQKGGPK